MLQVSRRPTEKTAEIPSLNKLSIAPAGSVMYLRTSTSQDIRTGLLRLFLWINWLSSLPILLIVKRGLVILGVFWTRLATFAGSIRAGVMAEIERNPLAVRQGAAAVACIAAAAVAMPVIAHRAAEQREGAEWAARSGAAYTQLAQNHYGEPDARVELTAYHTTDGLRARGTATLFAEPLDVHALLVQAALRGPTAPAVTETEPARPQQIDARQLNCLSEAVYYEARGESYQGQVAVAEVVMNRLKSKAYPKSVCAVVYQGSGRSLGCQFTFTCDGSVHRRPRGAAWGRAQQIAAQVMQGFTRPITAHATHYHTNAVDPIWSSGLIETTRIGSHVFYRFPHENERAMVQQAMMRRRAAVGAPADEPPGELIPPAAEAAAAAEAVAQSAQPHATTTPAPAPKPADAQGEVST